MIRAGFASFLDQITNIYHLLCCSTLRLVKVPRFKSCFCQELQNCVLSFPLVNIKSDKTGSTEANFLFIYRSAAALIRLWLRHYGSLRSLIDLKTFQLQPRSSQPHSLSPADQQVSLMILYSHL